MRSMEHPNISPDIENTFIGQLFMPRDMSDSYKALFSDNGHPPNML